MVYNSGGGMLYEWFIGQKLYPGTLGHGDIMDLAEKVSEMIEPFRSFFRAHEKHIGYDLGECLEKARKAEEEF